MSRKTVKIVPKSNIQEIKRVVDSIPKDVSYLFLLNEIKIGYILESYHWNCSYYQDSQNAHITTDYNFSVSVSQENIDREKRCYTIKTERYEEAEKAILEQLPEECRKYVKTIRTVRE